VYMLAGETEKIRGARSGGSREIKTWRLLFLSNGETTLVNYMRQAGIEPTAGALVRMPDIPGDGGAGLGCFEALHGFEDARTFAKTLKERAARWYGTAGPAFIEAIIQHRESLPAAIKRARADWVREALKGRGEVAAPVGRVADRFALLAIAGELASGWGITGWCKHEAERAVLRCFEDWLKERGGAGNLEEERIKANVRHFIELNGDAQFIDWERAERGDDHRPKTSLAAGLARYRYELKPTRYYVLRERFRRDLCKPYDYRDAERVLLRVGWIKESGDSPPRPMRNESLPIFGKQRCYVLELPDELTPAESELPPEWAR
jgi:putative DNA primase/helicase